jgi:GDP-mannose 6-dehydrogenase
MRVAVFGLGYVGCVTAACLADRGHTVVGVDVNPMKIELIANGKTPVLEPGLGELVHAAVAADRLRATEDAAAAVADADLSLVCVGTPSESNGSLSTRALGRALDSIGRALRERDGRHTVVVRSTILPGTCERFVIPTLESASSGRAGPDFGVAVNPEFLREGSSVDDFNAPAKTVIGEIDAASGDVTAALYEGLPGALFRVSPQVAELAKYVDNAFHALKIGFANEIGAAAREFGVDSHQVMEIFRSDRKLNVSAAYLTPGFAFGGSCLPKDLRALLYSTRRSDLELPILESVLRSNERHLQRTVDLLQSSGLRRVGIFGLAFKPGTDDLRESPLVELSERLLGKGFQLKIYDPAVSLSRLVGANKEFIESRLPHLSALLVGSADELVDHAEVCVVGAVTPEALEALSHTSKELVIDLVRLPEEVRSALGPGYRGVAW